MKCPKCGKKMVKVEEKRTVDQTQSKFYLNKVYHCEKDDIWVGVETPE